MPDSERKRVLILGASGMLGHAVLRHFAGQDRHSVTGSVRSQAARDLLPAAVRDRVVVGVDVENNDSLGRLFTEARPDIVINCIGLVKQLAGAQDVPAVLSINSLLPHRLARLCTGAGTRLIHISTDAVFSGGKGKYRESDFCDADDLYGRSKLLGEVDYPHTVTLRTSMIGHELDSAHGLVEWFLSQRTGVLGYSKAVFSGLTTPELARVMHDFIIPNTALCGVYHVSADPIDKFTLLWQIAKIYGKTIDIAHNEGVVIDRSLDSTRFRRATGYLPPTWPELIAAMKDFG
jgi:dTDP-4-dehydrorhamnose reductase